MGTPDPDTRAHIPHDWEPCHFPTSIAAGTTPGIGGGPRIEQAPESIVAWWCHEARPTCWSVKYWATWASVDATIKPATRQAKHKAKRSIFFLLFGLKALLGFLSAVVG